MDWQSSMNSILIWTGYIFGGIFGILLAVTLFRNVVWLLRYPFLFLNWVQWILYNPVRDYWRHPHLGTANLGFNFLFYSGIAAVWWLMIHIILTPLRFINALYFNIILYWSMIFCDSISELFIPRLDYPRKGKPFKYLYRWLIYFPYRLYAVFHRNGLALLEGILMTGVDVVLPTYTMYHGTSFKGIASNIAQAGRWYVGGGDYAGSGIYFGFYRKTAEHYAKGDDHAVIVARVTVFPCRNSATLPHRLRKKIGNDGTGISSGLPLPWKSIEHWRDHSYAQWFEYCLIQPHKAGKYVQSWRARPICVLKHRLPRRIWGGLSLWTGGTSGASVIFFSWLIIIAMIVIWFKYLVYLP